MCTVFWDRLVPIPGGWSYGVTNVAILEVNMLRNSSTLAASLPINISIKLGFVA